MGLGSVMLPYLHHVVTSYASCCVLFPVSMENRDLGVGFGIVFGGFQQFETFSSGLQRPVISHHTQI
jgi:hypothetical protein